MHAVQKELNRRFQQNFTSSYKSNGIFAAFSQNTQISPFDNRADWSVHSFRLQSAILFRE